MSEKYVVIGSDICYAGDSRVDSFIDIYYRDDLFKSPFEDEEEARRFAEKIIELLEESDY